MKKLITKMNRRLIVALGMVMLVLNQGNVFADTTLFSTSFNGSPWTSTSYCTVANQATFDVANGISFFSKVSPTKPFVINTTAGTMTWCNNNSSSTNYFIAIPVTNVNGSLTITVANGTTATRVNYYVVAGTTPSTTAGTFTSTTSANPTTSGTVTCTGANQIVYLGRQGSGYTTLTSITITTPTALSSPTTQANTISFSNFTATTMTAAWTRGNGSNVAVFMKDASGSITNPTDNSTYTASANWNSGSPTGTQLVTSGYYCVYNGSSTSVNLTNLQVGHTYYLQAFEYNGSGGTEKYYTATATGNPNNQVAYGVPTATTGSASSISTTGAALAGTINAQAASTTVTFDYGTSVSYGSSITATESPVTGITNTSVSGTLSSLTPNTLYHFRVKGVNSVGTTNGNDASFTTLPDVPTVGSSDTRTPTGFTAHWSAAVAPGTETYTYRVQVTGTSADYSSPVANIGSILSSNLSQAITGLQVNTQYFFRVRAENVGGAQVGAWSSESSGVSTLNVSPPTVTTASITPSINGGSGGGNVVSDGGVSLTARGLVWNTTSPAETGGTLVPEGTTTTGAYTQTLSTLSANTLYYLKAYATNSQGTSYGNEVSFTTLANKPTTASTVTLGTVKSNSIVVNAAGGDGGRRIVVIRASSAVNYTPTDGTSASGVNSVFTSATDQGSGNKVVYDGTNTGDGVVTVTGLSAGTTYYFAVFEYNNNSASVPNYYATSGTANQATTSPSVIVGSWNAGGTGIFGKVVTGTESAQQNYSVSGSNIDDNVTITPPSGFEISTDDISYQTSPVSLVATAGTLGATTIYVKYAPSSAAGATGSLNITNAATNATTQNASVTGTSISTEPSTQGTVGFGTVTTSTIAVKLPTIGNGSNRIIVARLSSTTAVVPTDATNYTANAAFGSGTATGTNNYVVYNGIGGGDATILVTVTGLSASSTYAFDVYEYNVGTGSSQNFSGTSVTNSQLTTDPIAYRTTTDFISGNWSDLSTWESYENSSWGAASVLPDNQAASIEIRTGTVTVSASTSAKLLTIDSGAQVTVAASQTLTVATDGTAIADLSVVGTLKNQGTVTLGTGATMSVDGTYEHGVNNITVPTATWNTGSTCKISGMTANSVAGLNQSFYHFIWDCTTQTASASLSMNGTTFNGDFTFIGNNSNPLRLTTAGTSSNNTLTFNGNIYVNATGGAYLSPSGSGSGTTIITLPVTGNISIGTGAVLDLEQGAGCTSTWNLSGNLSVSGTLMSTKSGTLHFVKSGTQTFTNSLGTLTTSVLVVDNGTTLDLGTSVINGSVTFTASAGSTIKTANTAGLATAISSTGTKTYTAGANYEFAGATTTPLPNFIKTTSGTAAASQKVIPFTNTAGVVVGMAVTGTNIAANSTVASFIANTSVTLNNNIATGGVASGASVNFAGAATFGNPNNVTISANVTLNAALTTGGLTLNSGTLADGGYTITNTGNITGTGTHTGAGKISMTGSGKTISGATLTNIELNNSGGFSLSGSPTLNGTLTLTAGSLTVGANTLTLNGSAIAGTPSNLVADGTSSIVISGSSSGVVIPSSVTSLNNFTLNNTNGTTLQNDLSLSGTPTLTSGTLTVGAHTLSLNGAAIAGTATNLAADGTSSISIGGSTSGVNIPSSVTALNNLTLNNTNGSTLQGNLSLGGTLSLTSGTLATSANTLTLNGAISGSGTISTSTSGTLAFGGAAVQTLANTNLTGSVVNNLVVNAGSQLSLSGSTITAANFTINSNGSGTGTILDGGLLTVTGTTNVNQHLTAGRNWYFSSPVTAATGSVVLGTAEVPTGNSLWQYNEGNANWNDAMTPTTPLTVTRGFIANNTSSGPITFNGTLNSGDITTPALNRSGATKAGFNLIGNPYPSYVNLATFSSTNDTVHLETTYWLRSKNSGGNYVFDTYNLKEPGSSISLSSKPVAGVIAPMQAFWVRVKSGFSSGSLTFRDSKRSHIDNATNVFRAPAAKTQTQSLLRLQVSNGLNYDEAVLYSNTDASNGYDDYDSQKYPNGSASIPEIYTLIGSEQLAINGMNSIPYDTEIPLGFSTGTAGDFSLKASQIVSFDPSVSIYLIDKNNGTNTLLTQDVVYPFSSGTTTNNTSRFALVFRSSALSTGLNPADTGSFWISTNANGQIQINGMPGGSGTVAVYNAVGQKLVSENLTSTTHALDAELVPAVYFVTVSTNGRSVTRKVIIN